MAFATPIAAFAATQRTPERFAAIFRFGIMPLFLFSGTFYPIESLPAVVQPLAWLTPLYHGVVLARGLSLGTIGQSTDRRDGRRPPDRSSSPFVVVGAVLTIRTVSAKLVRG